MTLEVQLFLLKYYIDLSVAESFASYFKCVVLRKFQISNRAFSNVVFITFVCFYFDLADSNYEAIFLQDHPSMYMCSSKSVARGRKAIVYPPPTQSHNGLPYLNNLRNLRRNLVFLIPYSWLVDFLNLAHDVFFSYF